MSEDEIKKSLKLLERRVAILEQQISKGNGKRAREAINESDAETSRKAIKREPDGEYEDPDDNKVDSKRPSYRKSNVRILRHTGAGKQNASILDRVGMTLDELITELDLAKPGAKGFIELNFAAHKAAIDDGTWKANMCFQLHHHCAGAVIKGQFPRHQISPTCGYCISRKGGPCRILSDGQDCERCSLHDKLCLTYEDLADIYKKMESNCVLIDDSLEKWPLIWKWLQTQTEQKSQYAMKLITAHINDRTEDVEHALAATGILPCKLFVFETDAAKQQKPMPRGWLALFCDDAVVHRRNVPFINLLRLYHLLQATTNDNTTLTKEVVEGKGQVSHMCKPIPGRYCWQPAHTVFESSDQNSDRDHYCFTARRLCRCQPPCLYNGEGGRFVPNVNPTLPQFGGWKPAKDRKMRVRYDTAEIGAISNERDLAIVSVGPSRVIELE